MQRSYQSYIRLLVGPMHRDGRLVRCWLVCHNFLLKGGRYRVFIKYCVFFEDFNIFSGLCFLSMSVCVHTPGR